MENNNTFFNKNDIEDYIKKQENFKVRAYSSIKEMAVAEKFLNVTDDRYNNVLAYTDNMYDAKNYRCYFIENEVYPDNVIASNEVIIEYSKDNLPISCYIEDPWGKLSSEINNKVLSTMKYFNKTKDLS